MTYKTTMHLQSLSLKQAMNYSQNSSENSDNPIAYTAKIVAAKRAIEQHHPSPLFHDPYAALLAGDEVDNLLAQWQQVAQTKGIPLEAVMAKRTRYIAIRTRFMDDLLHHGLCQLGYKQVVILGSGLDTRAFRLPYTTHAHLYEIDRAEILHDKMQVLQRYVPNCIHHPIAGDLTNPQAEWVEALLEEGYQPNASTVWIVEGVSMYLQAGEVHQLLKTMSHLSNSQSILGIDGVTLGSIAAGDRARAADRGRVVRHWQFGTDAPAQLLHQYGWQATVSQPAAIAGGYGRYPQSVPMSAEVGGNHPERGIWLASAQKT